MTPEEFASGAFDLSAEVLCEMGAKLAIEGREPAAPCEEPASGRAFISCTGPHLFRFRPVLVCNTHAAFLLKHGVTCHVCDAITDLKVSEL